MFASALIRVLAIIGFTLLPLTIVNVWFQEEVIGEPSQFNDCAARAARYAWLRAALNIIVGTIVLAFLLALVA